MEPVKNSRLRSRVYTQKPRLKIPFKNSISSLAGPITKHGDIDYEAVVKLSDGFNGADLRNVCTEAGLFAIR